VIVSSTTARANLAAFVAPGVFVALWSTGYIGAKYGLPYAPPFTFLLVRLMLATALLSSLALVLRTPWPRGTDVRHAAISGLLLHAGYLGGLFVGINLGVPAGLSAIIVNLQPVLTSSLAARVLGERVTSRGWLGLGFGFLGVILAVGEKLLRASSLHISLWGVLACFVALVSSTVGTIYQKRHGGSTPLVTGTAVQYAASSVVFLVCALAFERIQIDWTPQFAFALSWFVLVISLGAILLLLWLIRQNSASRVSSLFYLVPPLTALEAYLLFGERLGIASLLGLVLCALGVALVVSQTRTETSLSPSQQRT
jgi:drug/metabolite transporter (DMT)-like permease